MSITKQKVIIIDYGAGNVFSVRNALEHLGVHAIVSDLAEEILQADKIIFPGVGSAQSAMAALKQKRLLPLFKEISQPFLGVCLGMQLMGKSSEEGQQQCLNIIPYKIEAFTDMGNLEIPHMGWNRVSQSSSAIWQGIPDKEYFYFVHSYHLASSEHSIGNTLYGKPFCAAVQKDNFFGVQFHPEKSGKMGVRLLENFIKL